MDPTETLERIYRFTDSEDLEDEAMELFEMMDVLFTWLAKGGFPPDWQVWLTGPKE